MIGWFPFALKHFYMASYLYTNFKRSCSDQHVYKHHNYCSNSFAEKLSIFAPTKLAYMTILICIYLSLPLLSNCMETIGTLSFWSLAIQKSFDCVYGSWACGSRITIHALCIWNWNRNGGILLPLISCPPYFCLEPHLSVTSWCPGKGN